MDRLAVSKRSRKLIILEKSTHCADNECRQIKS